MNTLLFLQQNNYITSVIYLTLLQTLLNVISYSTYTALMPDNNDGYYRNTALSFYTGTLLLQSITQNNIIISNSINLSFDIFTSNIDPNKIKLQNFLDINNFPNYFNQTILNYHNDISFISNLKSFIDGKTSLTYYEIYTIINDAIKNYIELYLNNSNVLDNCFTSKSIIIT